MIIVGAGGHAREILDILIQNKFKEEIIFFDNQTLLTSSIYNTYPIIHNYEEAFAILQKNSNFCLGVGNPKLRAMFADKFKTLGGTLHSVIANNAMIGENNILADGLNVMSSAVISNSVQLGEGVLINALASVHHDAHIGQYSEICPGVRILGGVEVGEFCQIGANTTILPKVKIGNHVIIGAGAVVLADIPSNSKAVGIPAKLIFH
jgi:sugar O-acyltransferase (sialic acid O-acetyltransferase NeuD family)